MSKKANPTLVGTFVIVAIALAIGLVLVIGNIRLNEKNFRCVLYFKGSLHGLDTGSPVTYRGVTIGQVAGISIAFDKQHQDFRIPVYIDISDRTGDHDTTYFQEAGFDSPEAFFKAMIKRGLRAKLKMRSLVTGKLYIELAFAPWTPVELTGSESRYLEIPTIPSGLEQLTQTLENMPVKELLTKAIKALDAISALAGAPEITESLEEFQTTMQSINQLVSHMDTELKPLTTDLDKTLRDLSSLAVTTRTLLEKTEHTLGPVANDLHQVICSINQAAVSMVTTLEDIDQNLGTESELNMQLNRALQELGSAARAIRHFAGYLERHPEALIMGRGTEQ